MVIQDVNICKPCHHFCCCLFPGLILCPRQAPPPAPTSPVAARSAPPSQPVPPPAPAPVAEVPVPEVPLRTIVKLNLKRKRYIKILKSFEIHRNIRNLSFSKRRNRQNSSNLGWIMQDHERFMTILSSFHPSRGAPTWGLER